MFDKNTKNLWYLLVKELKKSGFETTKVTVSVQKFAESSRLKPSNISTRVEAQRCINLLDSFSLCVDGRGTKMKFELSQRSSKVSESEISFRFTEDCALFLKQLIEEEI